MQFGTKNSACAGLYGTSTNRCLSSRSKFRPNSLFVHSLVIQTVNGFSDINTEPPRSVFFFSQMCCRMSAPVHAIFIENIICCKNFTTDFYSDSKFLQRIILTRSKASSLRGPGEIWSAFNLSGRLYLLLASLIS